VSLAFSDYPRIFEIPSLIWAINRRNPRYANQYLKEFLAYLRMALAWLFRSIHIHSPYQTGAPLPLESQLRRLARLFYLATTIMQSAPNALLYPYEKTFHKSKSQTVEVLTEP
jgi:hypothetical protein